MARARKQEKSKAESGLAGVHDLVEAINAIYFEAMEVCLQPKLQDTLRKWIVKSDGLDEADAARAIVLIADLEVFAPSLTGMTSIDRLARRRDRGHDAAAAFAVLRRARFTAFRILSVQDRQFFAAEDLLTKETRTVFDGSVQSVAVGCMAVARLCALPDGSFAAIGPITPIDGPAVAVVMDFVKPGKGITNDHRCATALYRHVVRHGGPIVPGFNLMPNEPGWDELDDSAAPDLNPIDVIARFWHGLGDGIAPPAESIEAVRALASTDMVLEALFRAVAIGDTDILDAKVAAEFGDIYRRLAELMMETLHRRATAGSGRDRAPLDTIAATIADEIALNDYPPAASALFENLRGTIAAPRKPKTSTEKPGTEKPGTEKQSADDLTRVVERIRALRAKTIDQGCTESEAMAAATKVAELLDRYGLSLGAVDIESQTCQGLGIESTRKRSAPVDSCLQTIARFCDCRAWHETSPAGTIRSVFFGLPADVEAARFLHERVSAAFETETKTFKAAPLYVDLVGGERRTATNSFQIGLARGIVSKLNSLRDERETSFKTRSGRDLVLLKASTVEDELAKLGMSFTAKGGSRPYRIDREAFDAGEVAGRQFVARETLGD